MSGLNEIRYLKAGEAVPAGEPRRYVTKAGYVMLRWKVGKRQYVEVREHRVVAGACTDQHVVHHLNHDRADNRPENLILTTSKQHSALHGRDRMKFIRSEARRMYESGASITEVAAYFAVNNATVSRGLRADGTAIRPLGQTVRNRNRVQEDQIVQLYVQGIRPFHIAARLSVGEAVVRRVVKEHGLPSHRSGRPASPCPALSPQEPR